MSRLHFGLCVLLLLVPASSWSGLGTSFNATGSYRLEVTGVAGGNTPTPMGTLTLASLPPTATVVKATLYASQTNNASPLTATFAGVNLGPSGPITSDPGLLTMYCHQWDVTMQLVPGVTAYNFSIGALNAVAGVALSVVWSEPMEPQRTVMIMDGIQQVGESGPETESVSFAGLPANNAVLYVFTVNDDNAATGETITWNGSTVAGPIDRNLGFDASLFQINTTSTGGSNVLGITTGADHMGWMIGALSVDVPPVGVAPSTWSAVRQLYR